MPRNDSAHPVLKGVAVFGRFAIGLVLLATALGKALDVAGFVSVIETYQIGSGYAGSEATAQVLRGPRQSSLSAS